MIVSNFDAAFRVVASGLAVGIMPMLAGERFGALRRIKPRRGWSTISREGRIWPIGDRDRLLADGRVTRKRCLRCSGAARRAVSFDCD
jgi:DNA-binding transcriptional LysR family regulator